MKLLLTMPIPAIVCHKPFILKTVPHRNHPLFDRFWLDLSVPELGIERWQHFTNPTGWGKHRRLHRHRERSHVTASGQALLVSRCDRQMGAMQELWEREKTPPG